MTLKNNNQNWISRFQNIFASGFILQGIQSFAQLSSPVTCAGCFFFWLNMSWLIHILWLKAIFIHIGDNKLTGSPRVWVPGKIWLQAGQSNQIEWNGVPSWTRRSAQVHFQFESLDWVGKLSVRRRHQRRPRSNLGDQLFVASGFPWTSYWYWKASARVSINSLSRFPPLSGERVKLPLRRELPAGKTCWLRAWKALCSLKWKSAS